MAVNVDKMLIELEKQYTSWFQALNEEISTQAVEEAAAETVRYLKANSPKGDRKRQKYAKTWKADRNKHFTGAYRWSMTVYNDKNYRLTHLLEYGHAKVGAKGGRTQAIPHIAPAEEIAEQVLVDKVLDIISKNT